MKPQPRWLKIVLSIFVIYHLGYVVLMPNRSSWLTYAVQEGLRSYGNFFSIQAVWQMFAPDPAPAMYLEYEVYKDGDLILTERLPKGREEYSSKEQLMRRINASRFVLISSQKVSEIFIPWLCRENLEATDVRVKSIVVVPPTLEGLSRGQALNSGAQNLETQLAFEPCDRNELSE